MIIRKECCLIYSTFLISLAWKLIKFKLISYLVIVAGLYFITILDKKLFLALKELRKEIEQINNLKTNWSWIHERLKMDLVHCIDDHCDDQRNDVVLLLVSSTFTARTFAIKIPGHFWKGDAHHEWFMII